MCKIISLITSLSCNVTIYVSGWITRSLFFKLCPLSFKTVSINRWGFCTCIHPANLPLSVYCLLAKLFSRKYSLCSVCSFNLKRANISFSVVSLVKLPIYKSSISGLCMSFLLLLTIKVHSNSSAWIHLWWSIKEQSAHDFFFLFSVGSSFSDFCSSFDVFSLFFLSFMSSVFLLGWSSVLVSSKLAGILINCYY